MKRNNRLLNMVTNLLKRVFRRRARRMARHDIDVVTHRRGGRSNTAGKRGRKRGRKRDLHAFESWLPKPIDLIRWICVDIYRRTLNGRRKHLYGIWGFCGIYGGGKTISLVHYLEQIRAKYGDGIYIITNFFYKGQDFELTNWKQILEDYDRPVIFAYDELQNEFNSREYRKFPVSLMGELTQNRKGHGKQIVYTTQDFRTIDSNFRRLTTHIVACRTYGGDDFGRFTRCKRYKREFYENMIETVSVDRKFKIKPVSKYSFVQSDYLRGRYDSYQRLDSLRKMDFNDRFETKQNETV